MSRQQAADYRRRATHLRSVAAQIDDAPALRLATHTGPSTWLGPRADASEFALRASIWGAVSAAGELRSTAWVFEQRAAELEAAALAAEAAHAARVAA